MNDDDIAKKVDSALGSTYRRFEYPLGSDCPSTLLEVLTQNLEHIDENSWAERMEFGGVFINGTPIENDVRLCAPCWIEYYEPRYDYKNATDYFPRFEEDRLLYQDEHIAAYYKPAGLPSIPTKEQSEFNLRTYLETLFNTRVHLPSRLDVPTAGLIVASINPKTHNLLQKAFESRSVSKRYLCETSEHVDWEEKIEESAISRDPRHPILRRAVREGGKASKTIFRLKKHQSFSEQASSLLEVEPVSGRTHQIRVHAAEVSTPIVGDEFYGGVEAESLHLLSYSLEFPHPGTGETMKISIPDGVLPGWARE